MAVDLARPAAVRRARWLNAATIGWNTVEGVVAVAAGLAAGSISLVGFGLDSGIEVSAAAALSWRLSRESRDDCRQQDDRLAQRFVGISFALLAVYVATNASADLIARDAPQASAAGVALAATSLAVMPVIAHKKRQLAPIIGSRAALAEASQTDLCTLLSAALLVGLGLNLTLGWWWADPASALVIAGVSAYAAISTWRAPSLEHTCC